MKKIFTLILVTLLAISSKAQSYTFTYGLQVDTAATFLLSIMMQTGTRCRVFLQAPTGRSLSPQLKVPALNGLSWLLHSPALMFVRPVDRKRALNTFR